MTHGIRHKESWQHRLSFADSHSVVALSLPVFGRIQLLFHYYTNYDHVSATIRKMKFKRSSQLRTLLKRVVVNRTWKKFRPVRDLNFFQVLFTTTRFSSVLSCEDLLNFISPPQCKYMNFHLSKIFIRKMFSEEAKNAFHKRTHDFRIVMRYSVINIKIYNGNWTEWSAIWSETKCVIWNHKYDFRPKLHYTKSNYPFITSILKSQSSVVQAQEFWVCTNVLLIQQWAGL